MYSTLNGLDLMSVNIYFYFYFQVVRNLGGRIVENPKNCTHMVARSFSRTMKFFVAINMCHHIVNSRWVEDSLKQNHFVGMYRIYICV